MGMYYQCVTRVTRRGEDQTRVEIKQRKRNKEKTSEIQSNHQAMFCTLSTGLNIDGWKRFPNIVVKLKQRKIILEQKQGSNRRIKKTIINP